MRIESPARRPSEIPSALILGTGPTLRGLSSLLKLWCERSRERHQLALLTDRDLHDLGLTRIDAQQEARKPFWSP
jgi:uncharacterized protein YjiS (DUF1127 family)